MNIAQKATVRFIASALIVGVALCGCATKRVSQTWPVDRMVDPVTEETPNVIIDK